MSDIKIAINQLNEPSKSIGEILIEFYETMKQLEKDEHRGGKQATKIVMTMSDIEKVLLNNSNQKQLKWIKITDELPPFGRMVILCSTTVSKVGARGRRSDVNIEQGRLLRCDHTGYVFGTPFRTLEDELELRNEVTHWMPLPEKPTK